MKLFQIRVHFVLNGEKVNIEIGCNNKTLRIINKQNEMKTNWNVCTQKKKLTNIKSKIQITQLSVIVVDHASGIEKQKLKKETLRTFDSYIRISVHWFLWTNKHTQRSLTCQMQPLQRIIECKNAVAANNQHVYTAI